MKYEKFRPAWAVYGPFTDGHGMRYWVGEGRSSQFPEEWPHPESREILSNNGEDWEWPCDNCHRLWPEYNNGCPKCVKGHVEQPAPSVAK